MSWPVLLELPSIVDEAQCNDLLLSYSQEMKAASIPTENGREVDLEFRNNSVRKFYDENLSQKIYRKISHYYGEFSGKIPRKVGPYFRLYKYQKNQHFEGHQDGSYSLSGITSLCTMLIYLNDTFEGGETEFKSSAKNSRNTIIKPEEGKLIIFSHELPHRARSVIRGTKFVLRSDLYFNSIEPPSHFVDLR